MILNKGIPAAFIDSNSYLSPKLPNVIKAANKLPKVGTKVLRSEQNKRRIVLKHSFPILFQPTRLHISIKLHHEDEETDEKVPIKSIKSSLG